jgi:hypothetical protein
MTRHTFATHSLVLGLCTLAPTTGAAAQYVVLSPDGRIALTVRHDRGALAFSVSNGSTLLIDRGTLGLTTSRGDFTKDLRFVRQSRSEIDESYTLSGRIAPGKP